MAKKSKRVEWTKEHERDLKAHSKSKTPVAKIAKAMKLEGDGESARAHKKFYDEYLSVCDLPAEFAAVLWGLFALEAEERVLDGDRTEEAVRSLVLDGDPDEHQYSDKRGEADGSAGDE